MSRPDVADDPYTDLRRHAAQLVRLLADHPPIPDQQHLSRLDQLLSDPRLDHHPGARAAKARILDERATAQRTGSTPNWHRIGRDLIRIAGAVDDGAQAVDDTATAIDDTVSLASTAVSLAGTFAPLLLL